MNCLQKLTPTFTWLISICQHAEWHWSFRYVCMYIWETMIPFLKLYQHWVYLSLFPSHLQTLKYHLHMHINPTTHYNTTLLFTSIFNNLLAKPHPNIHITSIYVSWMTLVLQRHVIGELMPSVKLYFSHHCIYLPLFPSYIRITKYHFTYAHNPTTHYNTPLTI